MLTHTHTYQCTFVTTMNEKKEDMNLTKGPKITMWEGLERRKGRGNDIIIL